MPQTLVGTGVLADSRPTVPVLAAPTPQSAREVLNGLRARGISVSVEMCNELEAKALGIGAYGSTTPGGAAQNMARFTVSGGAMLARDWESLRRHRGVIVALLGEI